MKLTTHLHLVPILRISGAILLLLLYPFMTWTGTTLCYLYLQLFLMPGVLPLWDYEWGKDIMSVVKTELSLCWLWRHTKGMEVQLHSLTLALDGAKWLVSCAGCIILRKRVPLNIAASWLLFSSWCNFTLSATYLCLFHHHYSPTISNIYTEIGTDRGNADLTWPIRGRPPIKITLPPMPRSDWSMCA